MLGHHPTEDALAALELAQYFIKTGPRQVGNHIWKSTRTLTHAGIIELFLCLLSGFRDSLEGAVERNKRGALRESQVQQSLYC